MRLPLPTMLYLTVRNLVGVRVFRFAEVTAAIADLTPTLRKGFAGALCKMGHAFSTVARKQSQALCAFKRSDGQTASRLIFHLLLFGARPSHLSMLGY